MFVNGKLSIRAKIVIPANAKINLKLYFGTKDSVVILFNKPDLYIANKTWDGHFKQQLYNYCIRMAQKYKEIYD